MRTLISTIVAATALTLVGAAAAQTNQVQAKPTIVLVHGSLDDTSTWNDTLSEIAEGSYTTDAASYDLADVAAGRDDESTVVRSISARLAPIAGLYGAARDVQLSSIDRVAHAR